MVEAAESSGTRITSRCALGHNRDVYAVPDKVTNKDAWSPNTLIKQGAKLVAIWEELPADIPATLRAERHESSEPATASLSPDEAASPHQKKILKLIKPDESLHIDQLVQVLERELSSSEIFATLFDLGLIGKMRQLPGKNFVRSF